MSELRKHLRQKGFTSFEGGMYNQKNQIEFFNELLKDKKKGLQIGFNSGDSANYFLSINQGTLLSIDICNHQYVLEAEQYINNKYPNRHILSIGDSTKVIPELPDDIYDYIFIDGGHSVKVATADIANCKRLSDENTLVIIDDYVVKEEWIRKHNISVAKAVNSNPDFVRVGQKDFGIGRGVIYGYYKK